MLTHERLLETVHYDPTTGAFTRIKCKYRPDLLRERSIAPGEKHYPAITLDGKRYYLHRLAFFYMTGEWPTAEIDHKFGDRLDLRWNHLRPATRILNSQNIRKQHSDNKSGALGVSWDKARSLWVARIKVAGRYKSLGRFTEVSAAAAAYVKAKRQYHEGCTI